MSENLAIQDTTEDSLPLTSHEEAFESVDANHESENDPRSQEVIDLLTQDMARDHEAEASESPKQGAVARVLRYIESKAGEKASVVETDGAKALIRRTGHVVAEAAEKSSPLAPGVANNRISRFIDKIGINSEEARANDGWLVKKIATKKQGIGLARRARRIAAIQKRQDAERTFQENVVEPAHEEALEMNTYVNNFINEDQKTGEVIGKGYEGYSEAWDAAHYEGEVRDAEIEAHAMNDAINERKAQAEQRAAELRERVIAEQRAKAEAAATKAAVKAQRKEDKAVAKLTKKDSLVKSVDADVSAIVNGTKKRSFFGRK